MVWMRRGLSFLVAVLLFFSSSAIAQEQPGFAHPPANFPISFPTLELARQAAELGTVPIAQLPPEAQKTLSLIERGGPFPFRKDGTTFGNFEKRLPLKPKGYYREYTVITPGAPTRGARRLITGQGGELYYTKDHYQSFVKVNH
jgi:ribonuclease T1